MECSADKIITFTGKMFNPSIATSNDIDIKDIAHALSLMTRANGHIPTFYSVASHSIAVLNEAEARGYSKRVCLLCLLHDASEAYISDITRPVKMQMPLYKEIESSLQNTIYEKYCNTIPTKEENEKIGLCDDACLFDEFKTLTGYEIMNVKPQCFTSHCYDEVPFAVTEKNFLAEFDKLFNY